MTVPYATSSAGTPGHVMQADHDTQQVHDPSERATSTAAATAAAAGAVAPGAAATTGTAPRGERVVPYFCPFCAEEDLRPHEATHSAWHCRSCLRTFSVRFLGLHTTDPEGGGPR